MAGSVGSFLEARGDDQQEDQQIDRRSDTFGALEKRLQPAAGGPGERQARSSPAPTGSSPCRIDQGKRLGFAPS
jgi:hypothetical protein